MTAPLDGLDDEQRSRARRRSLPDWLEPMLARLTHQPFSDPDWIYERKLDGERVLAFKDGASVRLMSRNEKELGDSYPEIVEALAEQPCERIVLDGEVVAFDSDGTSDFQRLQPRMQASSREEALASSVAVYYYLFDCPWAAGYDLSEVSLRSRKSVLFRLVEWDDPLRFTPHRNERGVDYLEEACERGWEGLIAKQADSEYSGGRSSRWLKLKCVERQELVIGGFTEPSGERVGLGALLLGFYRESELVYAGKVGTGFDEETLEDLRRRLDRLERQTSPFDRGDPDADGVHFVTPKLVCEIGFTEWTDDDKLRHPRYLGLRRDKPAEDVHKEAEAQEVDS
ncbi:MAG: non-homologous end-joining DNA ligase [Thermoanaerobaculia bacterium]|nr:non-homologous end-joining DNA ligase [Thermoanaerobaculia bacterium]